MAHGKLKTIARKVVNASDVELNTLSIVTSVPTLKSTLLLSTLEHGNFLEGGINAEVWYLMLVLPLS